MIDVLKICSFHCSLCNNSAYFFWEVRRRHQQIQILYIDICVRNNAQYTLLGTNWIFIYRYCTYGSTIGVYNRLWWNKPCWWFLHTQFCYKVFIICQIFTRQVFNLNKWNCAFCIIFNYRCRRSATFTSFNIERRKRIKFSFQKNCHQFVNKSFD